MTRIGFVRDDFEVFAVDGFGPRTASIYERIRPRLIRLGGELAPDLARTLEMEFYPHVASHRRRTIDPPPETSIAFGPSPRGYQRHPFLALSISGAGLHARAIVKAEAILGSEIARRIESRAVELEKEFRGAKLARYDTWNFERMPQQVAGTAEFFAAVAAGLRKKSGIVDIGFGWPMREALRLDRAELLDAYRELAPFYRILRAV